MRVITKLDARDLLGVSENVIQYALYNKKVGCIKNKDFWVLKHSELRKYIADNNPIRRTVSALIVITECGFNKIRDFLKILNAKSFPVKTSPPTLPVVAPVQQVLLVKTTNLLRHETLPADVLLQFDKTKKALIALDVALDVYKLPSNFRKKSQNGIDALQNLAANVLVQTNQILCSYDHLQIQS